MRRALYILALSALAGASHATDTRLFRGGPNCDVWAPFTDGTARNWGAAGGAGMHSGFPTSMVAASVWFRQAIDEIYAWPCTRTPQQTGITGMEWAYVPSVATNNGFAYTNTGGALILTVDMAWHTATNGGRITDGLGTVTAYSGGSNLYCSTTGFSAVPAGARMIVYQPSNTGRVEYGGSSDAVCWPINATSCLTRTWISTRLWSANWTNCPWAYWSAPASTQIMYSYVHAGLTGQTSVVSLDAWHRHVFTVDLAKTNISLYVNGSGAGTYTLQATGTDSIPSVMPSDAWFHLRPRTFMEYPYFQFGKNRWWNRSMSDAEVYDQRNEQPPGSPP